MCYECSKCGKIYKSKDVNNKFLVAHLKTCGNDSKAIEIPSHVYQRKDYTTDILELRDENTFLKMELKMTKNLLKGLEKRLNNIETSGLNPDHNLNWQKKPEKVSIKSQEAQNYGEVMKELKSIFAGVNDIKQILKPIEPTESIIKPPIIDISTIQPIY